MLETTPEVAVFSFVVLLTLPTMGKKNKATTKSGKFVNPTDRARKEERKRELKKNKKQRLAVRTAVIKGKDPNQILAELERLDQMEFNVNQPPVLNEKVLM